MRIVILLSAYVVAALLGASAVDKAIHWFRFVRLLLAYPLVPAAFPGAVAGVVVAWELCTAVCLLFAVTRRSGFLMAGILFTLFAAFVAHLMTVQSGASCGCSFALGDARADVPHTAADACLALLCLLLWRSGTAAAPVNSHHPSQERDL